MALRCFEQARASLADGPEELRTHPQREWSDPHLRWCHERELFLHVSHACLSEDVECLDQIAISRLVSGPADRERDRVANVLDALNALKQEYTAARYTCWLSSDPDSPLREGMANITRRASYIDNLNYPRWGVRTGIAIQTFAATTNLLDKVASFVHLYYRTTRHSRSVYFRTLWHPAGNDCMDPELAQALRDQPNLGLVALLDLSCDLEEETPLARLLRRRNAATHRFLVAHQMFGEDAGSEAWLDHGDWDQLVEQSIEQLHVARAAILYLVRAVEIARRTRLGSTASAGLHVVRCPYTAWTTSTTRSSSASGSLATGRVAGAAFFACEGPG